MSSPITAIDLYDMLRPKLGEQEAKALTDYVSQEAERKYQDKSEYFASKMETSGVKEEIQELRLQLEGRFSAMEARFSALEVRIEQNTNKLLIWLVSVIFASSGLIVALIKLL